MSGVVNVAQSDNDDHSDGNGDTNIKEVMCMINANFYCGLKNRQECCS